MNPFIVFLSSIFIIAFGGFLLKVGRGAKNPPGFIMWYVINGVIFVISGLAILAGLGIWVLVQFLRTLT